MKHKIKLSKKFLIKEYIINKKFPHEIATELKCGTTTIFNYLKKYNIKTRSISETAKERFSVPENNINFKDGRTLIKQYCIEGCGREVKKYTAIRCQVCAHININSSGFIDGRYSAKHYCIEKGCSNEISYSNWKYGNKRCRICSNQEDNNGNWINGKSREPYPLDFNNTLKEEIRNRDNFACQNCGMTEEEHLIVIGTNLHVHHIDYNKENCNKDNLITTCKQCNIRANANRDYWKSFYQSKMLEILNKKE